MASIEVTSDEQWHRFHPRGPKSKFVRRRFAQRMGEDTDAGWILLREHWYNIYEFRGLPEGGTQISGDWQGYLQLTERNGLLIELSQTEGHYRIGEYKGTILVQSPEGEV